MQKHNASLTAVFDNEMDEWLGGKHVNEFCRALTFDRIRLIMQL